MPDRAAVLDEYGHLNFILSQLSKLHRIAYDAAEQIYLQDVARARQKLLFTGLATAGLVAVLIVLMLRQISQTLRRLAETERELQSLNAGLEQRVEERSVELAAAQEELLRKSRLAALGQLTGTVSHELRNPLGALRSSIAAIRRIASGETPAMHRLVEIADRSVTRCDELISDLLEYSRVRVLHREETDLDAWLTGVLDEIALPETVELSRDLACDRALSIDPERLRRVVINVVENACQAMTAGDDRDHARTGRLAISTRISETRAELRVADTGPGMDEETRQKIFEPLYSTKAFGVGLGLTVVRQIMEQHGGGVEIANIPGKGTEVVLWLPLPELARRAVS
jgi:signal transduction histidine kinase